MADSTSTPSSQGSTVKWNNTSIGRLTSWRMTPGTATFEEYTNVGSPVLGTGAQSRVVRQFVCTGVEPGSVTVQLFGCPPATSFDIGNNGRVEVSFEGGGIDFNAYVETFDVTGSVGEFLVGTATFKLSGQDWS